VGFTIPPLSWIHIAPIYLILAKSDNPRLSYWWFNKCVGPFCREWSGSQVSQRSTPGPTKLH